MLERRKSGLWFREELYSDVAQSIKVSKVLHKKTTRDAHGKVLHQMLVLETPRFGRVLTLDGAVQTTEADEIYYHEPLVHFAAHSLLRPPKSVLLIGCDGGTLREIVKYPSVEHIDAVDIDREVIDVMLKYIPGIPGMSFSDPRVNLIIADGAEVVKEKRAEKRKYDLVIIDSPDPIGPARSLFRMSFYQDVAAILAEDGIAIRQTGSSMFQPDEMPAHWRQMLEVFSRGDVQGLVTAVPTYVGGYFTLVAASHRKGIFKESLATLERRFKDFPSASRCNWYSPEMHRAAMVLPVEIQRAIEQSEFGRELILDLYGCDYSVISSKKRLAKFAREICAVIGMKPFGKPIIPDFGFAKSKTAGPSLVQLIETSAVTAHYSTHWGMVLKNIFTCSTLDVKKAVEFCMKYFGADVAKWELKIRGSRIVNIGREQHAYMTERNGDVFMTRRFVYTLKDPAGEPAEL
ncbi:MAG: hypothetical protein A3B29_01700 [Candidatus Sungbacteria bacterium RIFCSPLOWO2_01_FULL_51_34]|nr:MAG: hypothetical protein A3B29_01700 [Candidatus Sungbacteria bacterium RIFCSPLOWO2_01_FULL_51_34]